MTPGAKKDSESERVNMSDPDACPLDYSRLRCPNPECGETAAFAEVGYGSVRQDIVIQDDGEPDHEASDETAGVDIVTDVICAECEAVLWHRKVERRTTPGVPGGVVIFQEGKVPKKLKFLGKQ